MGKYFGTDGFRGEANERLTADHAFLIGRYLGWHFTNERKGERARIVVGKDTRRSSYMFEYALAAGITASGADAYLLHVTTTPSVSFVVQTDRFDCGVMISASHNPFSDNGVKLISAGGGKMEESLTFKIEEFLDSKTALPLARGEHIGRTVDYTAGRNRYLAYLLSLSRCSFRGMRVGLDCANGSAWAIAKAVFDALGADVFCIGAEPNGVNINENCGSTRPEALAAFVLKRGLDIGFAFDGDADRCVCIDEKGRLVDGDGILYLCAKHLNAAGELDGNGIVATVMSNAGLSRSLSKEGIPCAHSRVGDRFVYAEMIKRGCLLGGEQSGHIIFRKYACTGDGILTAVKVMETVIESKCPLSCLTEGLVRLPRAVLNVPVKDRTVLSTRRVKQAIARAEELIGSGRVLVRASGTEPLVRILAEGEREEICLQAAQTVEKAILEG